MVPRCRILGLCKGTPTPKITLETLHFRYSTWNSWWLVMSDILHQGCYKTLQIMGSTTNLNWWMPDFWTINSITTPNPTHNSHNITTNAKMQVNISVPWILANPIVTGPPRTLISIPQEAAGQAVRHRGDLSHHLFRPSWSNETKSNETNEETCAEILESMANLWGIRRGMYGNLRGIPSGI